MIWLIDSTALAARDLHCSLAFGAATSNYQSRPAVVLRNHKALRAWPVTRFPDTLYRAQRQAGAFDHCQVVSDVLAVFQAVDGDQLEKRHAQHQLRGCVQGNRPAAEYICQFQSLAPRTGFDEEALMDRFRSGLSAELRLRLASQLQQPETLHDLARAAGILDLQLREEEPRSTRQASRPPPVTGPAPSVPLSRPAPAPSAPTPKPPAPGTKLSAEERERRLRSGACLYCGGPGHRLDSCPKRAKNWARRTPPC